jgi:pantoate--beta-alanine ligase
MVRKSIKSPHINYFYQKYHMQIITTRKDLLSFYSNLHDETASIGFVPTMGALHQGHLSLIQKALNENSLVICSIYVNPTQFTDANDLLNYPRSIDSDVHKLKKAGCSVLFLPSTEEIYQGKTESDHFNLGHFETLMEGRSRLGHFQGVCTIVFKLFSIIQPDRAYFGLKDFQQVAVVGKMIADKKLPIVLVPCEIMREKDGLAMSSRNMRLSHTERKAAPFIYKTLKEAASLAGKYSPSQICEKVIKAFTENSLLKLDYFMIVNADTLEPLEEWSASVKMRMCIAATLGKIRLIDNMAINL